MSDRWLEELARVANEETARERRQLDERWDRLAAGTLEPTEEAALRAEAERSEEGRAAWEAFRPLGAGFEAQVVARLQAEQTRAAAPGKVVPFRHRVPLAAGLGLLAAGLVAFALLRPFLNPALPAYSLEVSSGQRGGENHQIVIGEIATLALQPETASRGRVEVQCFLEVPGQSPRFWSGCETHVERRAGGVRVVRLPAEATAELLPGRLRVVVGRPGRFPPAEERGDRDPEGRWEADWVPILSPQK